MRILSLNQTFLGFDPVHGAIFREKYNPNTRLSKSRQYHRQKLNFSRSPANHFRGSQNHNLSYLREDPPTPGGKHIFSFFFQKTVIQSEDTTHLTQYRKTATARSLSFVVFASFRAMSILESKGFTRRNALLPSLLIQVGGFYL